MNEMNESKSSFEKQIPIEQTILSFALVLRGSLKNFDNIKEYIQNFTESRIVYQAKSFGKLRIVKEEHQE